MLIRLDQLTKHVGGRTLFENVQLQVQSGDRIGLVGPNGAGKSTLLRIIHGSEASDGGRLIAARGVRVGMVRQEIDPRQSHSVRREATTALAHLDALEAEIRELESVMVEAGRNGGAVPAPTAERYDRACARFERGGGFQRDARVSEVLAGLGFDARACQQPLSSFSGGWLMRVELAKLLLSNPDLLLLDEPTNHLDLPAIQWLEETLEGFRGAVILVSHDRTLLRRHARQVVELDGAGGCAVYQGDYDQYLAERHQRQTTLLARKASQDRQIAHMERFVERFRAKATKARQAQSRLRALKRIQRVELGPQQRRRMRLRIPAPPRSGEVVLRLEGVHKSYGSKMVYAGVDLCVRRGDRVALAGPNGTGKSTLLRIIAGATGIDGGERTPGHNMQLGFFAQHQLEALDASRTLLEELAHGARTEDIPRLRGHLGALLFSGDDVDKSVSVLSGGEKTRLALAKMLLHPANLLVLDEPTNHLDIEACEVLEEALSEFEGTLVFVSHDRAFINALATRVVEIHSGDLTEYLGNYDDYLRKKAQIESPTDPGSASRPMQEGSGTRLPSPDGATHSPAQELAGAPPNAKRERQQQRERRKAHDRIARQIARLESEIQERETEIETLIGQLADPDTYRDPEQVSALGAQKAERESALEERYRAWELLVEELEGLD